MKFAPRLVLAAVVCRLVCSGPPGKWKRALARKGSVKLRARVTFVPAGGDPLTVTRKVKLVKKPARPGSA